MAAEAKDPKELTDGAKKVLDENDEIFCGFSSLQILDSDGYVKKTKGSSIEGTLHLKEEGDNIVLESVFPLSPLFYLQIANEEGLYVFGRWWMADAKWGRTNQICNLIPKDCQGIQSKLEGTEFVCDAEVPFLKDAPSRLVKVKFGIKEQRFITKVIKTSVEIPKASWKEWKEYRLKLWRSSKSWAGEDKAAEEEKDKKEDE